MRLHYCESLGSGLNTASGDHISGNLYRAGLADCSDMNDLLAAGLKDWTALAQRFICSSNIVNKLAFFSGAFAAGEACFDELRTAAFDNVRCGTHRIRGDRGMRKDDVTRRELFA